MPIDDAIWAQVRAAYCTTDLTVTVICKRFSVSSHSLYKRRIKDGWPLRGPNWTPPPPPSPALKAPTLKRSTRAEIIRRLYNAIDLKLTQMEKRMTGQTDTSAADHERETRAITGLIRNFERVTELKTGPTKSTAKSTANPASADRSADSSPPADAAGSFAASASASAASSAPPTNPASAELLRRDIADRLGRILAKGNPPGDAG